MIETATQSEGTCIKREDYYLSGEGSPSLLPFPKENTEAELQKYITQIPPLRRPNENGQLEDTSGQDILTLRCFDGICTCVISPDGKLLSYDFIDSNITSLSFRNQKFPGKNQIGNFLIEHLTGKYTFGETIRISFSNGVYICTLGLSSCKLESRSTQEVLSESPSRITEILVNP